MDLIQFQTLVHLKIMSKKTSMTRKRMITMKKIMMRIWRKEMNSI
jgi:hypothetical protein